MCKMAGLLHELRHPRRCYVVCTIPRSGSNLLTDGLRDTRRAGMPKQFFLPKAKSRYAGELGIDPAVDYATYVRAIVNTKITRNEVVGFKLMNVEIEKLCRNYERTMRAALNFLRIKLPVGARVGPPVTTRQADEISRMWEERFVAERPSAYSPASG